MSIPPSIKHFVSHAPLKLSDKIWAAYLQRSFKGREFTIISNNCWGAGIYPVLDIPYHTPFVGLFVMPACYVELVSDLRCYLKSPLTFVSETRYERATKLRESRPVPYPIGRLGNVEIHFLHYSSIEEAAEKWKRRCSRVALNDAAIRIKFCDHDKPTDAQIRDFDSNETFPKVFFTSKPVEHIVCGVRVPVSDADTHVPDGNGLFITMRKSFDLTTWLSTGSITPNRMGLTQCRLHQLLLYGQ